MIEWLQLPVKRQLEILNAVSAQTGLPEPAIEKDWWVTLALQVIFSTPWAKHLVFKGGTSLSKSWNLIERFSEDIDLVLDREVLGFGGDLSNTQIKNLRKAAFRFISHDFRIGIEEQLLESGADQSFYRLTARESKDSDRDPQVLELEYKSVFSKQAYIRDKVLLEVGARSLREPSSDRMIHSVIGSVFPGQPFSGEPFAVETVEPKRTFLEKAFLLHEELLKPLQEIRHERMSRHLYDLERMMDTEHGMAAVADTDLFYSIAAHRKKYTPIRGIDYSLHTTATLSFLPPDSVLPLWEEDYRLMRGNLIYGEISDFSNLLIKLRVLQQRFRSKQV